MNFEKKIGIVTVLYNSEKVLPDFFDSLNRQTYDNCNLYVIDNKSPDNSLVKATELSKSCKYETRIISNDDNCGVAKGNNQGIIQALADGCDLILLSNNDIVLESDTIENLYRGFVDNNADLAVPKIYLYDNDNLWCAGGKMDWTRRNTIHFGYNKSNSEKFSKTKQVSYAPTCFMLIDKSVFYDIGLMDEKYFVYYDDTDFIFRSQLAKKKLMYIATSKMKHKESVCTGKRSDFFYRYIYRNRIYFISKFKKSWKLFYVFDLIFNKLVRPLKMKLDKKQMQIVTAALHEGYRLALK